MNVLVNGISSETKLQREASLEEHHTDIGLSSASPVI